MLKQLAVIMSQKDRETIIQALQYMEEHSEDNREEDIESVDEALRNAIFV